MRVNPVTQTANANSYTRECISAAEANIHARIPLTACPRKRRAVGVGRAQRLASRFVGGLCAHERGVDQGVHGEPSAAQSERDTVGGVDISMHRVECIKENACVSRWCGDHGRETVRGGAEQESVNQYVW
jgi:hypothetical protein